MTDQQADMATIVVPGGREDPRMPNDNAPHGSRRPAARDHAARALARGLPPLWNGLGLRDAAAMLRHYLAGTGQQYPLDVTRLLAVPPVREKIDKQLRRMAAEARHRAERAQPRRYRVDSQWRGVAITRADSLDWWLALRGLQYRVTGELDLSGTGATATVSYDLDVHKSWNFDRGESEYGISFTPLARLHETGLAREFEVIGQITGLLSAV